MGPEADTDEGGNLCDKPNPVREDQTASSH
jgi:hypothetical protein